MARRISRRHLATLAAAGIASAQQSPLPDYAGPLEGAPVDPNSFDPVQWTMQRHSTAPLRLTFRAKTRTQAEVWQRALRAKLIELLGSFADRHHPLRPQTLEVRDFPAFKREKFVFESRPGVGVLGYLVMPKNARTPVPAVICLPGHGRGVDDIVGIDEHGRDRV